MSQERNQYFYDKYIHYGWSNTITQNCMFGQKDNSPNDYMYNWNYSFSPKCVPGQLSNLIKLRVLIR